MGIYESFTDGSLEGTLVGFDNYNEVLSSGSFHKASVNMLIFTGIGVPLVIALSLILALLLNRPLFMRNWLRTSFIMPLVVPVASVVMIWQILFDWNGTLNAWLHHFHKERIDWMQSDWSMSVVILMYLWKNIGYNMILFLAGLQSIRRASDDREFEKVDAGQILHDVSDSMSFRAKRYKKRIICQTD